MSEELKQEIIITVTASDFSRINPDIEPDDMRVGLFARRLATNIEQHLESLPERYHTSLHVSNARPSPWITINSEDDLPEEVVTDDFYLVICDGEPSVCFYSLEGTWDCPDSGFLDSKKVTHYRPIILPIPEK